MDARSPISAVDEQRLADDMDALRRDPTRAPGRWVLDFAWRQGLIDSVQLAVHVRQADLRAAELHALQQQSRHQLLLRLFAHWDARMSRMLAQIETFAAEERAKGKHRRQAAAAAAQRWVVSKQYREQANQAFLRGYERAAPSPQGQPEPASALSVRELKRLSHRRRC